MEHKINIQYYKTFIGELIIGSFYNRLCLLDYRYRRDRKKIDTRIQKYLSAEFVETRNFLLEQTKKQIAEYLSGQRQVFKIPILMTGTDFQKKVWKELLNIPYGHIVAYKEVAEKMQRPTATRATASAVGQNVINFIIPCHRVIKANGEIGEYAGGTAVKKILLDIEDKNK